MLPLRDADVRLLQGPATRHRELVGVGNTVNPNRPSAQQLSQTDRYVSRGGASRHDNVWSLDYKSAAHRNRTSEQIPLLPSIGLRNEAERAVWNITPQIGTSRDVGDVDAIECRPKSLQLHPVPAARRDRNNLRPRVHFARPRIGINISIRSDTTDSEGSQGLPCPAFASEPNTDTDECIDVLEIVSNQVFVTLLESELRPPTDLLDLGNRSLSRAAFARTVTD
jgi:hypothetical protein